MEQWLKLHTDLIDDEKAMELTDYEFRIMIFMWCLAKEQKKGGWIPMSVNKIAWRFRQDIPKTEAVLSRLTELKMLTQTKRGFKFLQWDKRQYTEGYLRIKRHREKYDNANDNAKTTYEKQAHDNANDNAMITPMITVEQNRTEKNRKELNTLSGKPDGIHEVIEYLNLKAGTAYRATTPATKKLIQARLKEGFTLEDFRRVIDNKCAAWLHDGDMSKYLRPATLFQASKFEGYLNERDGDDIKPYSDEEKRLAGIPLTPEEIEREQTALGRIKVIHPLTGEETWMKEAVFKSLQEWKKKEQMERENDTGFVK